jgi:glycosyltransferase involved in cell wall biosynthesis
MPTTASRLTPSRRSDDQKDSKSVTTFGSCILAAGFVPLVITFVNALYWPRIRIGTQSNAGGISVLIPARNEEASIAACISSVMKQGNMVREILVYDDHSEDRTAEIVRDLSQADPRVRCLEPSELPNGWCGKTYACSQLAGAATSEWMLFLDADARLEPFAVAGMLAEANTRKLTLLSSWPRIEMGSFWERVLMPMVNFTVFSIYPAPLALIRQEQSLGLAHGACILVHRATYLKLGGHEAVKNAIFEDTELARVWRRGGERGLCLDGFEIVRVRMYDSFNGIWGGFRKNFYPAFRHSTSFWLFMLFHFCLFFMPFIAILFGASSYAFLAAAALVGFDRVVMAVRFNHPIWSVLFHPLAEGMMLALGMHSWWSCVTRRGVDWKGRTYHPRP